MPHVSRLALTLALGLSAGSFAFANDAHHGNGAPQVAQASTALTDGEVKKIDKDTGKITIKHGPLTKLEMPAMTMVFRVANPKMLDQVKAGDKIKFEAVKVNGALTVVTLEPA
jgi:Cu(I)/Ag(I) efflux system periplasmic protein CusF